MPARKRGRKQGNAKTLAPTHGKRSAVTSVPQTPTPASRQATTAPRVAAIDDATQGETASGTSRELAAGQVYLSRPQIRYSIVGILFTLSLMALGILSIPLTTQQHDSVTMLGTLRVIVSYNSQLVASDDQDIFVTVANLGDVSLTDVVVTLGYTGTLPLFSALDESNAMRFGALAVGERKTKKIKILLPETSSEVLHVFDEAHGLEPVRFQLLVSTSNSPPQSAGSMSLQVAQFTRLRSLLTIGVGLMPVLALWLMREIWEEWKEAGARATGQAVGRRYAGSEILSRNIV